jgi:hypothetical protein
MKGMKMKAPGNLSEDEKMNPADSEKNDLDHNSGEHNIAVIAYFKALVRGFRENAESERQFDNSRIEEVNQSGRGHEL